MWDCGTISSTNLSQFPVPPGCRDSALPPGINRPGQEPEGTKFLSDNAVIRPRSRFTLGFFLGIVRVRVPSAPPL